MVPKISKAPQFIEQSLVRGNPESTGQILETLKALSGNVNEAIRLLIHINGQASPNFQAKLPKKPTQDRMIVLPGDAQTMDMANARVVTYGRKTLENLRLSDSVIDPVDLQIDILPEGQIPQLTIKQVREMIAECLISIDPRAITLANTEDVQRMYAQMISGQDPYAIKFGVINDSGAKTIHVLGDLPFESLLAADLDPRAIIMRQGKGRLETLPEVINRVLKQSQ